MLMEAILSQKTNYLNFNMSIIPTLLALQTMYYARKHREEEEEEKDKEENDDD